MLILRIHTNRPGMREGVRISAGNIEELEAAHAAGAPYFKRRVVLLPYISSRDGQKRETHGKGRLIKW